MATLASGASVTFPIAVDQVLTFTASTATGRAVLSAQKGGDVVFNFKNEAFNNTPIFSPGSSGIVTITSTLNPITYAVSNSQFPAYATDSSGNVTGLVGPDGNTNPIFVASMVPNGASNLKLRKIIANVLAGGRERIAIWGDSTTAGAGAGTNGSGNVGLTGAFAKSWPTYFAAALTAAGIPTWNQGLMGSQNVEADTGIVYNAYDPRAVFTGFTSTAIGCPGSNAWLSSGIGSTIAFTPAMTFDRFDIYTVQNTSNGTITANVDGGATLATIVCAGSAGIVKTTVSCTRGTHTINLATTLAANTYVIGIIPWDSTIGGLDIVQCGNYGSVVSQFAANSNPWNPSHASMQTALGASMHIIQLTVNDSKNNTVPATYATNLATFQSACGVDSILMSGLPSSNVQATNGQNAAIVAAMKDRAATQSIRYLGQTERLVDWATVNGYGWMFDTLHGNAKCYSDEARWVAKVFTNLA